MQRPKGHLQVSFLVYLYLILTKPAACNLQILYVGWPPTFLGSDASTQLLASPMPDFYIGPGDMNSGPHAWAAGRLQTETSPDLNSLNSCASTIEHTPCEYMVNIHRM